MYISRSYFCRVLPLVEVSPLSGICWSGCKRRVSYTSFCFFNLLQGRAWECQTFWWLGFILGGIRPAHKHMLDNISTQLACRNSTGRDLPVSKCVIPLEAAHPCDVPSETSVTICACSLKACLPSISGTFWIVIDGAAEGPPCSCAAAATYPERSGCRGGYSAVFPKPPLSQLPPPQAPPAHLLLLLVLPDADPGLATPAMSVIATL